MNHIQNILDGMSLFLEPLSPEALMLSHLILSGFYAVLAVLIAVYWLQSHRKADLETAKKKIINYNEAFSRVSQITTNLS